MGDSIALIESNPGYTTEMEVTTIENPFNNRVIIASKNRIAESIRPGFTFIFLDTSYNFGTFFASSSKISVFSHRIFLA